MTLIDGDRRVVLGSIHMKPRYGNISWSRGVVLAWASLWLLAVPLFHVHPEADHHHGEVGHIHGGTVHTVFSGDLDCESGNHDQVGSGLIALSGHASPVSHEHAELGFSLLNDSGDRKPFKPLVSQALCMAVAAVCLCEESSSAAQRVLLIAPSILSIHEFLSRAPPSLRA